MAGQSRGSSGAGTGVSGETALKPWRNYQAIDFVVFPHRFQRFHAGPRVYARVCACTDARAYMCEEIHETVKPTNNIITFDRVRGFREVSKRFHSETGAAQVRENGGFQRFPNILAAGYWLRGAGPIFHVAPSTVLRGRGGETFGFARRAAASAGCVLVAAIGLEVLDQGEGGNGGNPPFSRGAAGHVGRVMLEGRSKGPGNAGFWRTARKPVRLGRRAALGGDRAEAPPHAPFRAPISPSTLARERGRISIGNPDPGVWRWLSKRRQSLSGMFGSGLGFRLARRAVRRSGQGSVRRGNDPRRRAHASGGVGRVN